MKILLILTGIVGILSILFIHSYIQNKQKRLIFLKDNQVNPKMQKYLTLGAILIETNESTSSIMKLRAPKEQYQQILMQQWSIADKTSLFYQLNFLLENGGDAKDSNQLIDNIRIGKPYKKYNQLIEDVGIIGKIPVVFFETCQTLSAWDIERAAFLIRISAHIGYITEEKAFTLLKERVTPILKKQSFTSWEEYSASFILGRILCYSGDLSDIKYPVEDLLYGKEESVWKKYKLTKILT